MQNVTKNGNATTTWIVAFKVGCYHITERHHKVECYQKVEHHLKVECHHKVERHHKAHYYQKRNATTKWSFT